MRTYARIYNDNNEPRWIVIETDAEGFDDYVWANTLIQSFKLLINESPFYGNYGVPAFQAVAQQIAPDPYVSNLQSLYSQYFASLVIARVPSDDDPTYQVNLTFQNGVQVQLDQLDGERYSLWAVTEDGTPGVTEDGIQIIVG